MPDNDSHFRLLVVRLGAMGDILHALPAVTALRRARPDWQIGWAVEPQWRSLLAAESSPEDCGSSPAMPLVDRIHAVPAKAWARRPWSRQTLNQIRLLRRELAGAGYDAALDLQGALRSALVARGSRAPRIVGEQAPREAAARYFFSERVPVRAAHVIDQAVEVAAALLGEPLAAAAPLLPVDEQARSWCRAWVGGRGPLVVLMPGAGWGAKRWPAERYARVAGELVGRGAEVVVNVGPGEAGLAEAICRPSGARALECSLSRLIELLRGARLAIGGDTGPLHLAAALGVPVVAIFGPTDPARNGPYGVPMRVLRHPDSRRDHARRAHPEAGLLTIEPAEVLDSALELLGEARTCPSAENPAGTLPTP